MSGEEKAGVGVPGPPRASLASEELTAGEIIGEHYRVVRRIGAGGMGSVYVVEHLGLGKRFAAKVVSSLRASDEAAVGRLRNEARTLSAVEHENIVTVTHLGQTEDGRLFVVMELLEGEDLGGRLVRQGQLADTGEGDRWLPNEEIRAIVPQLLSALSAAHGADVVHRDLKPDNLFLAERHGRTVVKVVDFGISKIRGGADDVGLTRTGQILGTPLYMAPEQGKSTASVDARADIYSLGCILHQLFTGYPPFQADSVYECVVKHATEEPPRLSTLRPDLPPGVEAVVWKCLAKHPADRFDNVTELATAWAAAWQGMGPTLSADASVFARTTGSMRASRAPARRRAGVVAVALVLLLGAGGMVLLDRGGEGEEVARAATMAPPTAPVVEVARPEEPEPAPSAEGPEGVAAAAALDRNRELEPVAVAPAPLTRRIESTPGRATVRLEGKVIGQTPLDVELAPGEVKEIELRRRGYQPHSMQLSQDSPETVEIRLRSARRAPPLAPR